MDPTITTVAERPEIAAELAAVARQAWPRFMLDGHNEAIRRFWPRLATDFPEYQFAFCDADGSVMAAGHSMPFAWDGTDDGLPAGWDAVLEKGCRDRDEGLTATALTALSAVVLPGARRRGLSTQILREMKALAREHGLGTLVAPARPPLKRQYPLTPMESYIRWTQDDGSPFDPWLRAHWRLGARIARIAHRSMVYTGTVAEWEEWCAMRFPESGRYVIPGGIEPLLIDRERGRGLYEEPNVWMVYDR